MYERKSAKWVYLSFPSYAGSVYILTACVCTLAFIQPDTDILTPSLEIKKLELRWSIPNAGDDLLGAFLLKGCQNIDREII